VLCYKITRLPATLPSTIAGKFDHYLIHNPILSVNCKFIYFLQGYVAPYILLQVIWKELEVSSRTV
jgi:hypothetical protein